MAKVRRQAVLANKTENRILWPFRKARYHLIFVYINIYSLDQLLAIADAH